VSATASRTAEGENPFSEFGRVDAPRWAVFAPRADVEAQHAVE